MKRTGRLLVLGFEGTQVPAEVVSFAERFGLGGVILFRKNCPDAATVLRLVRETKAELRRADPGCDHLVFVDQEGGRVERIHDGVSHLPAAGDMAILAEERVAALAEGQAQQLSRLGIQVNLAPVCDVLQPGESGDIGDRSFGVDDRTVSSCACAFIRGALAGGVLPCAKHFPGLGAARVNSHRGLPVVEKSWQEIERFDLRPFRAAVSAGVPLVMAAHLVLPCLSAWPASLSPEWIGGVLRGRLGFSGVVLSDDMEMGALHDLATPREGALRAVAAGCDLLIYGRMLRPDIDPVDVVLGLEAGLEEKRIEISLDRISTAKRNMRAKQM